MWEGQGVCRARVTPTNENAYRQTSTSLHQTHMHRFRETSRKGVTHTCTQWYRDKASCVWPTAPVTHLKQRCNPRPCTNHQNMLPPVGDIRLPPKESFGLEAHLCCVTFLEVEEIVAQAAALDGWVLLDEKIKRVPGPGGGNGRIRFVQQDTLQCLSNLDTRWNPCVFKRRWTILSCA